MNKETIGALKRILEEVKEKRETKCIWIDCPCNHIIGGNDIDLIESWMKLVEECRCGASELPTIHKKSECKNPY